MTDRVGLALEWFWMRPIFVVCSWPKYKINEPPIEEVENAPGNAYGVKSTRNSSIGKNDGRKNQQIQSDEAADSPSSHRHHS